MPILQQVIFLQLLNKSFFSKDLLSLIENFISESTDPSPEESMAGCKREINKRKRNAGQEYMIHSGNLIGEREMQRLELCRAKCQENISFDDQTKLFRAYWKTGTYEHRFNVISTMINLVPKKFNLGTNKQLRKYTI